VGSESTAVYCGVKDYTLRLASALQEIDVGAQVMSCPSWDTHSLFPFYKRVRSGRFDVVHVQYPSIGFRWSLAPHLLGLTKAASKTVVTLHDYSTLPLIQRISAHLFQWTTDGIVFTTDFERQKFLRPFWAPSPVTCTIPIGSNVPSYPEELTRQRRVVYFGQIKPGKGIESFVGLAQESIRQELSLTFLVIGSVPERHSEYLSAVRGQSPDEIEWVVNLPLDRISEVLAGSLAAYLPFPDGASYRRGSMLAALMNGLPVIAPSGAATPRELADTILSANGPAEAAAHLKRLCNIPAYMAGVSAASRRLGANFSWLAIAREHQIAYERLLTDPAATNVLTSARA
jgi:glycosyltransferase involved in cell wall biosynthesis